MKHIIRKTIIATLPYSKEYRRFSKTKNQSNYLDFLKYKLGIVKKYWPSDKRCTVANYNKVYVGINSLIGRPGCYIQGAGIVKIGNYVQFGPNVGILSANHDLYDQNKYNYAPIIIGDYSWLGMNSIVTAGVELGTRTIVAAGAVVTKSFPEGFCILAGVPAKKVKVLDPEKFKPWYYEEEFYGFVPKEEFEQTVFYKENF